MLKRSINRTTGANPRASRPAMSAAKTAPAPAHGEFYAATVPQAESAGFRRTHKWTGVYSRKIYRKRKGEIHMSTTIYEKSSKDADIEITRLQDRLMAEVINNLYPQTAIEENAAVQKILEILQTHGFKIRAQQGGHILRTPSVRSSYTLENLNQSGVNMAEVTDKLSDAI